MNICTIFIIRRSKYMIIVNNRYIYSQNAMRLKHDEASGSSPPRFDINNAYHCHITGMKYHCTRNNAGKTSHILTSYKKMQLFSTQRCTVLSLLSESLFVIPNSGLSDRSYSQIGHNFTISYSRLSTQHNYPKYLFFLEEQSLNNRGCSVCELD